MTVSFAPVLLAAIVAAPASDAPARPGGEERMPIGVDDAVITGALAASVLAGYLTLEPRDHGPRGGDLFDDDVRGVLRAETPGGRARAEVLSDLGQGVLIAYPFVVDAAAVAFVLRDRRATALRLALVDAQAFLLSSGATLLTKNLVGRERPYAASCAADGASCASKSRYQSFISGHAAAAFTGAGLVCLHHEALPLYGSPGADAAACLGAIGVAGATGLLRIVADDHFATDVLAGAAVGALFGYVFPRLVYFDWLRAGAPAAGGDPGGVVVGASPRVGPGELGLEVSLVF